MNEPIKKFKCGSISATIWENQQINSKGESFSVKSVVIERSYKDKDDNWQKSSSFRVQDLPKVNLVCQESFKFLQLDDDENKN